MFKLPLDPGRLAFAVLAFAFTTPTWGATLTSDAFVATAGPTIEFLDASGRLALTQAGSARIRAFGQREMESQAIAIEALADWRRADAAATRTDEAGPSLDHLGPLASVLTVPYDALAHATSIASPPLTVLPSADTQLAASRDELAHLETLRDAAFADAYATSQIEALRRLEAAYKSFILNGDDPSLRRLAVENLPRVESLLARARRL